MSGFSGMKAWLIQRFSGIYIALFAVFAGYILLQIGPMDYALWVGLLGQPFVQVTSGLFVFALLIHAWIGLRDVILDYIKPIGVKLLIMSFVVLALLASGLWFLRALLLL